MDYSPCWSRRKVPRVLVHLRHVLVQIHLRQWDHPSPFQELPPKVQQREHSDHRVRKEERRELPVALDEDREAVQQRHDYAARHCIPRQEWLHSAFVWKCIPRDALCLASFFEPCVGESNDGEVDQLRCGDLSTRQHEKLYPARTLNNLPR